jgi:hypothetical protein
MCSEWLPHSLSGRLSVSMLYDIFYVKSIFLRRIADSFYSADRLPPKSYGRLSVHISYALKLEILRKVGVK